VSPWWLRPTADSEKQDTQRRDEPAGEARAEAARPEKPPASPPAPPPPPMAAEPAEPADRAEPAQGGEPAELAAPAGERRPASRGRRGGRSRRPERPAAAETAPAAAEPERPPKSDAKPAAARKEAPVREPRAPRSRKPAAPRAAELAVVEELPSFQREPVAVFSYPAPERTPAVNDERKIALFCDLENVALGVRDSDIKKFDINLVLERLVEKGKIIVKRAYCDWERYSEYKRAFHEAAIEMLDIPQKYYSGKNSADIKMVVDALDLCYAKEHLDTFVLLSGDSDFSPLVSKLRENDKYVIGMGVKNSSSALLIDNCDEFIFYEDVWRDRQKAPQVAGVGKKTAEAFELMIDAIQALSRENKDVLWGSMIKQTMQRKRPSFNEGYYGYGSFSELLEDAEKRGLLKLKKDQRSGSYVVTGFARK
jgi:uncharacterized protein (TIGR00288 family)